MISLTCTRFLWSSHLGIYQFTKRFSYLVLSVFLVASCGGGSVNSDAPTEQQISESQSSTVISESTETAVDQSKWETVISKLEDHDINELVLLVGNEQGELFSYQKGNLTKEASVPVASASKWLTSATILALVEQGVLNLQDHPQKYLDFWTDDPEDPRSHITLDQLLSFTSGFHWTTHNTDCIGDEGFTLIECAHQVYEKGLNADPATTFYYGPAHMQISAAMAEAASGISWAELFHLTFVENLNLSNATGFFGQNPRTSGTAASSAADYSQFLHSLMNGNFIGSSMSTLIVPRTLDVDIVSRPAATNEITDWQYGLGVWRECNQRRWDNTCESTQIVSSPGRYGWYPWIDLDNGYYAVLAMNETPTLTYSPSKTSIELGNDLHPLILQALQTVE